MKSFSNEVAITLRYVLAIAFGFMTLIFSLSADAGTREWDALECQRKGGVYDAHRQICTYPNGSNSAPQTPAYGGVIAYNYCRSDIWFQIAFWDAELEENAVYGWYQLPQRIFKKRLQGLSGDISEGFARAGVKGTRLLYNGAPITQNNSKKIYVHGSTDNGSMRWEGSVDAFSQVDGKSYGFTNIRAGTSSSGDAEIMFCND